MKAAVIDRFGGPEEIYYTDIEKPVPGPDEVLVRNVYIGVGKPDYIMRSGICPFLEAKPPKLVVGNECAGIVEAVGSDVKGIEPGMKVCVNSGLGYGAYAEYIAVPQKFVTVFPDEFPLKYAPGFLNYMVAYALLNEIGRGTDGKSIYIYGAAGGVGTAVIQTALLQGIEVIASASSQEKCDYIKSLGAQCVFNHKEQDAKEVIMDYTRGRGVDLIFDQLVGKRFASQFEYLADFGMIVIYNWLDGSPELDQLDTIIKQSSHASAVRSFSFHIYDDKPERLAKIRKICMDRIISGEIKPHFYMDLPLSEARKAHELMDGLQIMGKLILHVEE
ncbi:MAG: quinone oxidoreductase family protein [Coprococcus sp.]